MSDVIGCFSYDLLDYSWTLPSPNTGNVFFRYKGAKIEIVGAQLDNNGDYTCTVRDQDKEVSMTMSLYVYGSSLTICASVLRRVISSVSERPRITKALVDLDARAGQDFTLSCEASGEPAPAYRWYFNGRSVPSGLQANGNALRFYNVKVEVAGMYQCEAYNQHGNAVTTAQIRVDGSSYSMNKLVVKK